MGLEGSQTEQNPQKRMIINFENVLDQEQFSLEKDFFGEFVHETMDKLEKLFNSEESNGKYLDLNDHFRAYKDLKLTLVEKEVVGPEKPAESMFELPKDYLTWLSLFHVIPENLTIE